MKLKSHLITGLLCAIMVTAATVPAFAHGGRGHGHHHGGCARNVQNNIAVCPYEDCSTAGRHIHDDVTYCGYNHCNGVCDGSCVSNGFCY